LQQRKKERRAEKADPILKEEKHNIKGVRKNYPQLPKGNPDFETYYKVRNMCSSRMEWRRSELRIEF
jgi:hypothetical protein